MMNIHELMAERSQLAAIYAQDGALRTAARILRELADDLFEHADRADALLGVDQGESAR
ncbi:hypothetical protein [Sphingomonas koreensis]|uniref:hypothetical protein n=1 Tax=Sphingomonas koreensis TaxID=93064 RepID=UPI0013DDB73B|nr:hypothetical protein [Sphingomonas koreensis]MDC7809970.1 hypothetical protein [Sphingomonas koreensis]